MATVKGIWRFNDVLSLSKDIFFEAIDFMSWEFKGYGPVQFTTMDVTDGLPFQVNYYGDSVAITPYFGGWKYGYEKSRTVIFTSEQTVSYEFYEWFTANAVEQKEISGVWKFNDVLTQSVGGDLFEGHFTTTSCLNAPPIPEEGFDGYVGEHTFECTEIYQEPKNSDADPSWIGSVSYTSVSAQPEIPDTIFPARGYVYGGGIDGRGWDTVYGRGCQTIDFGTEPQYVSEEFYSWLTTNAL
jgi:hypothetical protein